MMWRVAGVTPFVDIDIYPFLIHFHSRFTFHSHICAVML